MVKISDRELLVLKRLWDICAPATVMELVQCIADKYGIDYKQTTVYIFLKRLRDKGYVDSYKKGPSFFFPLVEEMAFGDVQVQEMIVFWGARSVKIFLCAYANYQNYTDKKWANLCQLREGKLFGIKILLDKK